MIFSIHAARTILADAATLAQDISSHCEAVHRRQQNPTFCDGHHNGAAQLPASVNLGELATR
jgi:hypothetical protein